MDEAASVLQKHWGMRSPLRQETSGGSRPTWPLENGYWLSRCGAEKSADFRTETALLNFVQKKIIEGSVDISIPEVVLTISGISLIKVNLVADK